MRMCDKKKGWKRSARSGHMKRIPMINRQSRNRAQCILLENAFNQMPVRGAVRSFLRSKLGIRYVAADLVHEVAAIEHGRRPLLFTDRSQLARASRVEGASFRWIGGTRNIAE